MAINVPILMWVCFGRKQTVTKKNFLKSLYVLQFLYQYICIGNIFIKKSRKRMDYACRLTHNFFVSKADE